MRLSLLLILSGLAAGQLFPDGFNFNSQASISGFSGVSHPSSRSVDTTKDTFLDSLVVNLTVPELGMCIHFFFKRLGFYVCLLYYYGFGVKLGRLAWLPLPVIFTVLYLHLETPELIQ